MKWVKVFGQGHAMVTEDQTACGFTLVVVAGDEVEEAAVVTERPFGVDTDRECHAIVKGWALHPETQPGGLFEPKPVANPDKVMTAEARRAAIDGTATENPPEPERAQVPARGRSAKRDTVLDAGDDIEFPPEEQTAGLPVVDGALVVKPTRGRKSSREAADIEIDS